MDTEDVERIATDDAWATVVRSARQIDPAFWGAPGESLAERCYRLVETSLGGQFDFYYVVLNHVPTGQRAVQPFFSVEADLTAGIPLRVRKWLHRFLPGMRRLSTMRLIMVGCAAGEGSLGCGEAWALELLDRVLMCEARRQRAGLIVFKDLPARYRKALGELRGYRRVASMPSTRLDLSFASFDDYLRTAMSRGIRSNLRRKFRGSERLARLSLEVTRDVAGYVREIHDLYLQTYRRSGFRFECLTQDFFSGLARFPEARFFLWRRDGRVVAFAAGLIEGRTFRYLNLGMDYAEALELHLYFWVWRGVVTWAIEHRMEAILAGQLNYEPKFRLGLKLVPLDLHIRPVSAGMRVLLPLVLPFLAPVRYDPALRRFSNFDEL